MTSLPAAFLEAIDRVARERRAVDELQRQARDGRRKDAKGRVLDFRYRK